MYSRKQILSVARSYRGTRFQHQGRLPGIGLDCAGVLICVARAIGYVAPDFDVTGYARRPSGDLMLSWCDQYLDKVAEERMQPADVAVFKVTNDPQHVGILGDYRYGGLSIIHAISRADGSGSVVDTRLLICRGMEFVSAYQFREVDAWLP